MAEEAKTTPEAEVKAPEAETTVETTPEVTKEPVVEKTISEMVPEKEPEKPNLIPESVFLGEKKARKAAEKELARLKAEIEGGASREDISDSIDAIAEEHDIDKSFLKKLASTIKAEAKNEAKAEWEAELKAKSEGDSKVKQFEDSFAKGLQVALERGPEFKNLVNVDVIKQLALLPQNSKKTISQLLEDTYGNAIQGKRTIETETSPGGGKDPEPLNFKKAQTDIEYFKEVMADPKKKAQYNEEMMKKGY